ncbi:hypothetical protein HJC23_002867 [Cyclotella cryptica]|uniref:Uncharacterized protein n=1 Tax=Cyclotella cryptica TaxID=29204 RepID=A0ABD3PJT3_9STRA|eukprot:CCRYP_013811-RA/>CCRYP_013811-RA protein AED:0.16 eAED:0.16 QI:352/1/1/1/1/1/4/1266/1396
MTTSPVYNSFIDMKGFSSSGAASVSSTSHSTTTSPSRPSRYHSNVRQRDQQIFRRAGAADFDSGRDQGDALELNRVDIPGSDVGAAGAFGGRMFQQQRLLKNQQQEEVVFMSHEGSSFTSRNVRNSSVITEWPDATPSSFHLPDRSIPPKQHKLPQSSYLADQFVNLRNVPSSKAAVNARTSHENSNNIAMSHSASNSSNKSHTTLNHTSVSSSQATTTSSSQSSSLRQKPGSSGRGGVVTKLVSYFSTTKSTNQATADAVSNTGTSGVSFSPTSRATTKTASAIANNKNNPHRSLSAGVQFQNLSVSTDQRLNEHDISHSVSKPMSPNTYPPISPARSNTQSSVSGGDSSSYNPTGWPGTVDKRGKTYTMEPSYSESEEGSWSCSTQGGSPRNRIRLGASVSGNNEAGGGDSLSKHVSLRGYPMQQYRHSDHERSASSRRDLSFDGGDSQAELEEWINGDPIAGATNHADEHDRQGASRRSNGPIDLDEVYEQRRHFDANGDGWRVGHRETLTNISETRTAADFHLAAALRTSNGGSGGRQSLSGQENVERSLSRPYPLAHGRADAPASQNGSSDFYSSNSARSIRHEESILSGIDTSLSEKRVRASGRSLTPTNASQQQIVYDDEVDFGVHDDEAEFEYSPDDINVVPLLHSHIHGHPPPTEAYDDEADFEYSPDDYNVDPRLQPNLFRHQPPTEEALRLNDSRSAPPRSGGSVVLKGYRGFIDKTRDVPNLMDDLESEASTSLGTNADGGGNRRALGLSLPPPTKHSSIARRNSNQLRNSPVPPRPSSVVSSKIDSGSDVFEGIQGSDVPSITSSAVSGPRLGPSATNLLLRGPHSSSSQFKTPDPDPSQNTFPRTHTHHQSHEASHDFDRKVGFLDSSLNLSAVTKGSADGFSHHDIVDLDDFADGLEQPPDLSKYCVQPEMVRMMVRAFRKMCTMQMEISSSEDTMLSEFEDLVDTKKRFALFEMRSRIMETDIDRGLERRGGTNVVDDIVLTPYFQALHRVRDAVIVSKAWRDGATPKDVVTAHLLTRRSAKAHFVRRPIKRIRRPGGPSYPAYWLEEVTWLDETDFALMRCQSLGAGTMKGFEMFTIGDCQSILLKMTSDNCTQLRRELRSAMMCQIEAEELMQEEIDLDGDQRVVAEAEELYRDATVEVKQLSMKLVLADRAFSLVRSRMEKLVETIESLLVHIENEDEYPEGTSSSTNSSERDEEGLDCHDDYVDEEREREKLLERARRAEMSAEIAIRETLLAKQEAEKIKSEKQREIDELKEKLSEMESQSQHLASRYSSILAGSQIRNSYLDKIDAKSILEGSFDRDMEDAREAARDRVKLKFRERRAIAPRPNSSSSSTQDNRAKCKPKSNNVGNAQMRGEEIYQHLDFYSRSLQAVRVDYDH